MMDQNRENPEVNPNGISNFLCNYGLAESTVTKNGAESDKSSTP